MNPKPAMTSAELSLAAVLLEMASDEFANHGCTDLKLENTDANWEVVLAMHQSEEFGDEWESRVRPAATKDIYTDDWLLMSYLAHRLKSESISGSSRKVPKKASKKAPKKAPMKTPRKTPKKAPKKAPKVPGLVR